MPDIEGTWNTWSGDRPIKLQPVHAALWQSPNGTLGIIAANADTQTRSFVLADLARHIGPAAAWEVSTVTPESEGASTSQGTREFPTSIDVPARTAVLLKIKPVQ